MGKKKTNKRRFPVRNAGFTATFSMALVLFLIGLLTLSLFLARDMADYVRENLKLSLVLQDNVNAAQANEIRDFLLEQPYTKELDYISKDMALKEHIESLGEDPSEFLGFNPLSALMEVKLNATYANGDSVAKIETQLKRFGSKIEEVSYQKDVITEVNKNIRNITIVFGGLALALLLISFVLINNTVRLRIYANRFLINTMKLVGAKGWFIRRPYIAQSIVSGIVATIIAWLLLGGVIYYGYRQFGLNVMAIPVSTAVLVASVMLVLGILLTAISSYFSVGRYIRMQSNDMYFV